MPTINVVFFGLISHVGRNHSKKAHAALIRDVQGGHQPYIHFSDGTAHRIGDGTKVTFTQAADATSTAADFADYVPHLGVLSEGNPSDAVINGTDFGPAQAYVRYPGGELRARTLYTRSGIYKLKKKTHEQCVAKTVMLTVTTGKVLEVTFTDDAGQPHTRPIPDGECILITNGTRSRGHDFKTHGKVVGVNPSEIADLTPGGLDCRHELPPTSACSWVEDAIVHMRDATEIECGNTQYP
jgi:hypothetical protein